MRKWLGRLRNVIVYGAAWDLLKQISLAVGTFAISGLATLGLWVMDFLPLFAIAVGMVGGTTLMVFYIRWEAASHRKIEQIASRDRQIARLDRRYGSAKDKELQWQLDDHDARLQKLEAEDDRSRRPYALYWHYLPGLLTTSGV